MRPLKCVRSTTTTTEEIRKKNVSVARAARGQKQEPEPAPLSSLPFATPTCQQLPCPRHPQSSGSTPTRCVTGRGEPVRAPEAACACSMAKPIPTDGAGRASKGIPPPPSRGNAASRYTSGERQATRSQGWQTSASLSRLTKPECPGCLT